MIRRIYAHAIEKGWVEKNSVVIDPFGGVALGGLEAMRLGLHWVGVELEARFCALAQDNIDLWNKRYSAQMPNWGTAVIVQGDSRRLGEVLERASLCLSSPPYANSIQSGSDGIDWGKIKGEEGKPNRSPGRGAIADGYSTNSQNLGNLPDTGFEAALAVSSPVYHSNTASDDPDKRGGLYRDPKRRNDKTLTAMYSENEAQLAQMPEGDLALAISSPPFLAQSGGTNVTAASGPLADASLLKRHSAGNQAAEGYGISDGQLAALPEGSHAEACERPTCAISSPPFERSQKAQDVDFFCEIQRKYRPNSGGTYPSSRGVYAPSVDNLGQMPPGDHAAALETGAETGRAQACISSPPFQGVLHQSSGGMLAPHQSAEFGRDEQAASVLAREYGQTPGNIGNETGSTFWAASRQILEEVYKVLAPGGHCIFVCKRFVRDKKIIEFSMQWAHLCEAVGFKWIHHHKAWLVEERGAQHMLEGGLDVRQVKRMSFFRRLHSQKYPHLEILYEDVLCFVKEPQ